MILGKFCSGKAIKGKRDQYVLATKFGLVPHADGKGADVDGSPEHVRSACEASLKRLQTDYIDLYYQHRVDRKVGVETTVREMKASLDYHAHGHCHTADDYDPHEFCSAA